MNVASPSHSSATPNACSRAARSRRRGGLAGAGGERLALLQREVPVDAVLAVLQGALQLRDQLRDHLRVVRQPGSSRKLRRVDLRIAGQELAQHVAKLVFRFLVRIIRHGTYANRLCGLRRAF